MVGAQEQVKVAKKSSIYDTTHKKPAPPNQKFCFECKLQDLLCVLTLRPGP